MKNLRCFGMAMVFAFFIVAISVAQTSDVTVVIKGMKEVKGNVMVAAGDMSNPGAMKYAMVEVTTKDSVVCVLKDVPVGKCNLYVYQDINENNQLDKDENKIPVELCYTKEKVTVKEGGNRVEVKLIDVKKMMGN